MSKSKCKMLVLDAGPLLSLSPLRGLAEIYVTTPQVLAELRDKRARDHFERLGLTAGVKVDVQSPDPSQIAKVIEKSKQSGDYAVLSHADISIMALTAQLQEKHRDLQDDPEEKTSDGNTQGVTPVEDQSTDSVEEAPSIFYDPEDEDDEEGEWITPSNVGLHKSRALDLLPTSDVKGNQGPINVGCMTADFAMQNVLLQMGLNLVSIDGRRIEKVKSWVLRCHACFKICKDNSKKFCPSCGNPTLLRASVTISSPTAANDAPVMEIHLKKNFQYKTRGTKYSIPAPKPGSSKAGSGEGLILREDQADYMNAKKRVDNKKEREEAKMLKGIMARSKSGDIGAAGVGTWNDPDWLPEMISVGAGGKGRSIQGSDMPTIGYKGNPNAIRKKKK